MATMFDRIQQMTTLDMLAHHTNGVVAEVALALTLLTGAGLLIRSAIALNGVATGLYIAARFGPGPRDGLMTGLNERTGRSIRQMRTLVEVAVVVTGFVLGGTVGVGTVLYALCIGPLAQFFLRLFAVPASTTGRVVASGEPSEQAILQR